MSIFDFKDVAYDNILSLPELIIKEGSITAFIGSSGSGKSTVLKLLSKLISPTRGQILYHGIELRQIDSVDYRRKVTLLPQNPAMFEGTIRDNLVIGHRFQHRPLPEDTVIMDLLFDLKLDKPLEHPADKLSGGEKQRVALGRLMLLEPDVYLLDEPSSALDEQTELEIINLLAKKARSMGSTLIMATHSKAIAKRFSDVIFDICAVNRNKAVL